MTPPYYVVWSGGPAVGDGTPAGSVHPTRREAERVAIGRSGALSFAHGPSGPATWRVWVDEVTAAQAVLEVTRG